MVRDDTVAVVGAGVIGAAVACALTREGRAVSTGPSLGASFGNAGHIAVTARRTIAAGNDVAKRLADRCNSGDIVAPEQFTKSRPIVRIR